MSDKVFYTLEDLRSWTEVGAALHPPARLAVIGDPIAHSRSPQMHNPALAKRGIAGQYIRVHVPPGSVPEAMSLFAKHGFVGVNCTIPHKFEALDTMDVLDDLALKLGAVNTVAIRDGKLCGFNSDGPGFLRSVEAAFGQNVRDLRVLIIGAGGGAGRAVAVQCALEKCPKLVLVNRTTEKLQPLAQECRETSPHTEIQTIEWNDQALADVLPNVDLIVNATPIGMKAGNPDLFDLSLLNVSHLVYDMVYRADGETSLIAKAKEIGAKTCHGLVLLLHQGAVSFGHWFGDPVPIEEMQAGLRS